MSTLPKKTVTLGTGWDISLSIIGKTTASDDDLSRIVKSILNHDAAISSMQSEIYDASGSKPANFSWSYYALDDQYAPLMVVDITSAPPTGVAQLEDVKSEYYVSGWDASDLPGRVFRVEHYPSRDLMVIRQEPDPQSDESVMLCEHPILGRTSFDDMDLFESLGEKCTERYRELADTQGNPWGTSYLFPDVTWLTSVTPSYMVLLTDLTGYADKKKGAEIYRLRINPWCVDEKILMFRPGSSGFGSHTLHVLN